MDVEANFVPHYLNMDSMQVMVEQGVKPVLFADEMHGDIFDYSLNYFLTSGFKQAVPRKLLEDEFPQFFKKFEWPEEEVVITVLVDKLKEKYKRAQAQDILRSAGSQVMEDPDAAVQYLLGEAARVQFETSTQQRLEVYSANFANRVDTYSDRAISGDYREGGIPICWPEVTAETFGLKKKELAVLVAFANTGKSWFCCQMVLNAALAGYKVYFPSLENNMEMTLWRLDCLLTGVPYREYERGQLNTPDIQKLRDKIEIATGLEDRLVIDTPSTRDERTVSELYMRAKFMGADLLVGDQLSWLTPRNSYRGDLTKEMAEVINDVADMTRETGVASLWAAQFNREAMKSKKGAGGLENIALSSQIEQLVDWAFSLSATKDIREDNGMVFSIIKARRSRLAQWLCEWRLDGATNLRIRGEYDPEG